ncbi:MAG: outer membrane beta-barrel protein, partial [Pseudohongiellaceae bacterium]
PPEGLPCRPNISHTSNLRVSTQEPTTMSSPNPTPYRAMPCRHLPALLTAGLLALLALTPASADQRTDEGMYISASVGQNRIQSGLPEQSNTLLKAAFGWQFFPNLGLEVSYNYFKDFPGPTPAFSDFSPAGASVTAIGQLPLSRTVAVFARGGQFWWSAKSDFSFFNRSGGPNQTGTVRFSEAAWLLGVGGSYELTPQWELELEYNYYDFSVDRLSGFDSSTGALVLSLKWEL